MKIGDLRKIGRELFVELGETRLDPSAAEAIGKGAGGDRTFPIDKKAEDIIIRHLESLGEPLSIISEELGTMEIEGGGRRVVIDPIDGSKNAISGVPFYCSSIAVAEGDTIGGVELAYVLNLPSGDEFWAERGAGAFFNGRKIHTQESDSLSFIAYEAQTPGTDIPKIMGLLGAARRTRCFGAIALDLAYLAYGSVSVLVNPAPSRSFDFAGGWLLVKEAGGVFTDMEGNSLEHIETGLKRSTPLLASGNAALHEKALRLLHG